MGRYSNKFVLCILVNGQVQKDLANGEVHIPFGSEYAVRLRNKNNRRAVVDLVIDGETVGSFVVKANNHLDVKRWADKDVAFKFVDLESPDAYDHGKQGANPDKLKGTVEARFRLEKENPKVEHIHHYYPYPMPVVTLPITPQPYPKTPWYSPDTHRVTCDMPMNSVQPAVMNYGATGGAAVMRSGGACNTSYTSNCSNPTGGAASLNTGLESLSACMPAMSSPTPLLEGCTVEGNKTGQQWVNINVDTEDTETVLQVFLKGYAPYSAFGGHVLPPHVAQPTVAPPVQEVPGRLNCGDSLGFCPHCGKARQDKMHQFCGTCGNRF